MRRLNLAVLLLGLVAMTELGLGWLDGGRRPADQPTSLHGRGGGGEGQTV